MVILIKHWYRHKEHPFPLEMHTVLYTYFFLYVTIFLVFIYIWIERQWIVEVEISKMWKRLFFSPCSHFSNALYPLSLLICNTEHLHSWFKSLFTRYYLQDAKDFTLWVILKQEISLVKFINSEPCAKRYCVLTPVSSQVQTIL